MQSGLIAPDFRSYYRKQRSVTNGGSISSAGLSVNESRGRFGSVNAERTLFRGRAEPGSVNRRSAGGKAERKRFGTGKKFVKMVAKQRKNR